MSGTKFNLFAVTGFLGAPDEFTQLYPHLSRQLFTDGLNTVLACQYNAQELKLDKPTLLMGYSLGGRLILPLLKQPIPNLIGIVFISTHPGLEDAIEQRLRVEQDQVWANRFATETLPEVLQAWNSQPALQNTRPRQVIDPEWTASKIQNTLTEHSLGKQRDYRSCLTTSPLPYLWVTGEDDYKFSKLADSIGPATNSKKVVIPGAGHRVHWDQPKLLADQIEAFGEKLR